MLCCGQYGARSLRVVSGLVYAHRSRISVMPEVCGSHNAFNEDPNRYVIGCVDFDVMEVRGAPIYGVKQFPRRVELNIYQWPKFREL